MTESNTSTTEQIGAKSRSAEILLNDLQIARVFEAASGIRSTAQILSEDLSKDGDEGYHALCGLTREGLLSSVEILADSIIEALSGHQDLISPTGPRQRA